MDDALRSERLEEIKGSWLRLQLRKIAERRALAELIAEAETEAREEARTRAIAEAKAERKTKPKGKPKGFSPAQVAQILALRAQGQTYQVISDGFGVALQTVWAVCNGERYREIREGLSHAR